MIKHWLLTGDCHGNFTKFKNYDKSVQQDEKTAVIILGDAGLNWSLDENDSHMKNFLSKRYKFRIYCVRGNHEARPQDVPGMELVFDEDVEGEVYVQKKWPNIKYFKDWGIYRIGKFKVAVIGGAYSVDKWYRLENGYRWYDNEQLSEEEMLQCTADLTNEEVDIVLSHTCPINWEPTDLFLNGIDQSRVDKSMELFLEELGQCFKWTVWCFGHYHADRLERPGVEQFFNDTEDIKAVWERWIDYLKSDGEQLDWWLSKSPMFYADDVFPTIFER